MILICPKCGENNDSKFAFCVKCGTPLKAAAKSPKTASVKPAPAAAQKQPAPQPKPAAPQSARTQKVQQAPQRQNPAMMPQNPQMPNPAMMPQNPQMQNPAMMPQNPQMQNPAMMPQNPQMQNPAMMPQNPQMPNPAMMPQNPQMQNPAIMPQNPQMQNPQMPNPAIMPQNPQMQNPAMMPQNPQMQNPEYPEMPQNPMMQQGMMNPQMMGIMPPQMMGMMPQTQFVGYDQNGMPMYMQMMPQFMGYDAYGNPIYTMVPMQAYAMPQMGMMPQQPVMQQPMQGVPPMQGMPMQQPMQQPVPPMVQGTMQVSSFEEMPVSAESLMDEDEEAEDAELSAPIPDETELLNQIFSDHPKHNTMSAGTKPSAQTFSISLSACEVTSVRDEAPPVQPAPKPEKKQKKVEAKELPPKKQPQRIVSPDEFFGDTSPVARRYKEMNVDTPVIEDDDQLEAQIAALEAEGHKRSKRTMQAADSALDAQTAVDDPSVSAAAQALLNADAAD